MEHFLDTPLSLGATILLGLALACACAFEFVNGFHDTSNAVATVIYTKALRPWTAVIWSAFCNFIGVYIGGIAVAMSILKLLPAELLVSSGHGAGLAMVLALLLSAILWNGGTWYFGLPASSSHTLIGAIIGVGLANSLLPGHAFGAGVNWGKAREVGAALVFSPVFGMTAAAMLLLLAHRLIPDKLLHAPPEGDTLPPTWVRAILVSTCTGVSFAHGSNDGQKGVGLIMLILIGLLPADFALNRSYDAAHMHQAVAVTQQLEVAVKETFGERSATADRSGAAAHSKSDKVLSELGEIRAALDGKASVREIPVEQRWQVRSRIVSVDGALTALEKDGGAAVTPAQSAALKKGKSELRGMTDYAPFWVLVMVAVSLGIGTMTGWKRIVVTVGEKIGKTHLTYAQGAAAEMVAAATIGLSAYAGLPVSTTHVLSSGVAGAMIADKSGLQASTVRNIGLAWVLTLPVAMLLAGVLFLLFHAVLG